jgi:hypothetical protein
VKKTDAKAKAAPGEKRRVKVDYFAAGEKLFDRFLGRLSASERQACGPQGVRRRRQSRR